jgi:hypothetical protein
MELGRNIRRHAGLRIWQEECPVAGSSGGGRSWAIPASLVNTAKLSGSMLADVPERIVSGAVRINDLERLLSWAWKISEGWRAGTKLLDDHPRTPKGGGCLGGSHHLHRTIYPR